MHRMRKGFTLVEIMIVVIILGILASVVLPQFSNATQESRENMLKENLRILRTQIGIYRIHHLDTSPGIDEGGDYSDVVFVGQLTGFSSKLGAVNNEKTGEFCLGPYLSRMPRNPINNKDTILITDTMPEEPSDNFGWVYIPEENTIMSDSIGADILGDNYFDY